MWAKQFKLDSTLCPLSPCIRYKNASSCLDRTPASFLIALDVSYAPVCRQTGRPRPCWATQHPVLAGRESGHLCQQLLHALCWPREHQLPNPGIGGRRPGLTPAASWSVCSIAACLPCRRAGLPLRGAVLETLRTRPAQATGGSSPEEQVKSDVGSPLGAQQHAAGQTVCLPLQQACSPFAKDNKSMSTCPEEV